MKETHVSDRFRSKITGNVYEVKQIVNKMIVPETPNRESRVLTDLNNMALFYERESKDTGDQG